MGEGLLTKIHADSLVLVDRGKVQNIEQGIVDGIITDRLTEQALQEARHWNCYKGGAYPECPLSISNVGRLFMQQVQAKPNVVAWRIEISSNGKGSVVPVKDYTV